jgi:hypothetical protein
MATELSGVGPKLAVEPQPYGCSDHSNSCDPADCRRGECIDDAEQLRQCVQPAGARNDCGESSGIDRRCDPGPQDHRSCEPDEQNSERDEPEGANRTGGGHASVE